MTSFHNTYVSSKEQIDFTKLFVFVEYYDHDTILLHRDNFKKLNKKHGCNISPDDVLKLYIENPDFAVCWMTGMIYEATGKRPKNLVHIAGPAKGRGMDAMCYSRIALLDVNPKNVADKEPDLTDPRINEMKKIYEEFGKKLIIKNGKK